MNCHRVVPTVRSAAALAASFSSSVFPSLLFSSFSAWLVLLLMALLPVSSFVSLAPLALLFVHVVLLKTRAAAFERRKA